MAQNDLDVLTDVTPESLEILRLRNPKVAAWYNQFPWANLDAPCRRGIHFDLKTAPYDKRDVRWALAANLENVSIATFSGMLRASALEVPPVAIVTETYHAPMRDWLAALEIGGGQKPFDPDFAPQMAERLRKEGIEGILTTPPGELDRRRRAHRSGRHRAPQGAGDRAARDRDVRHVEVRPRQHDILEELPLGRELLRGPVVVVVKLQVHRRPPRADGREVSSIGHGAPMTTRSPQPSRQPAKLSRRVVGSRRGYNVGGLGRSQP